MKNLTLVDCDRARAEMLYREIGKVRCWLEGFAAGRNGPGTLFTSIAGEDSLRQIQIILKESMGKTK